MSMLVTIAGQVVAYAANEPGPQYEEQQAKYNIAASQIAIIAGIMYTGTKPALWSHYATAAVD
jgi:hypothetical protein